MGAWGIRTSKPGPHVQLEVLKNPAHAETTASVVVDASTVTPDVNGVRRLVAGTLLSKNVSNQYERFTGAGGQAIRGVLAHDVEFPDGTSQSDEPAGMWCHLQWFRADRIVDWVTHGAAARTALPTCKFD